MGGANLVKTFYLDSDLKHEVIGNTGVKEQVIVNSAAHNSPSVTSLAVSDVASNNWRTDGTRVTDNTALEIASGGTGGNTAATARAALGVVGKAGDYLTGPLILGQGYAAQFAGSASSYLDAGNNAAIMRGGTTEPFTIACKLQLDPSYSAPSGSYPLISIGRYYLQITPGLKIRGGIWGGGNPTSMTTLVPGTIYDVIFDWDGANSSIAIDNSVEQTVASGSTASGANHLYLGKRNGESGTEFKGVLDAARMWNRTLTAGERSAITATGIVPASGLVLELGFDLQTVADTSSTGNATSTIGVSYVAGIAAPIGDGVSALLSLGPIRIANTPTPASTSAAGNTGEVRWDANYVYICTATNTWKRVAIGSW